MITLDDVRAALRLPDFNAESAHLLMSPGSRQFFPATSATARQAGVLVLLFPQQDDLCFVLTRRTDTLRGHSGQISFPGGRRDPQDDSFVTTALRETCEELGVCDDPITILGELTRIYIPPSDFEVVPVVGAMPHPPVFRPSPAEVAEVFTVSLSALLDEGYKAFEYREFRGVEVKVPYYALGGHKVWGATAIMLSELEARLRVVVKALP